MIYTLGPGRSGHAKGLCNVYIVEITEATDGLQAGDVNFAISYGIFVDLDADDTTKDDCVWTGRVGGGEIDGLCVCAFEVNGALCHARGLDQF